MPTLGSFFSLASERPWHASFASVSLFYLENMHLFVGFSFPMQMSPGKYLGGEWPLFSYSNKIPTHPTNKHFNPKCLPFSHANQNGPLLPAKLKTYTAVFSLSFSTFLHSIIKKQPLILKLEQSATEQRSSYWLGTQSLSSRLEVQPQAALP